MIRRLVNWRYLWPRVAIGVVVALVIWLGMEPVLHSFLVGIGERIVRAKIDIDDVEISLASADLKIAGARVANPRSLERNLIEFESATLDVVPGSLLQRRLRVREATMTGVRFNTRRSQSGKAELPPLGHDVDELDIDVKGISSGALRHFARVISQDLQDELLSLQLSRELSSRWPEELQALEVKVQAYVAEVEQFAQSLKNAANNPRGAATAYPDKVRQVEQLRREYWQLKHELDRIVEQVERDREAIAIARRHDETVIRRKLALRDLDPQQLSEYLLGERLTDETRQMLRWIKLARRYWPSDLELPAAERSHGEDIAFPGLQPLPRALVDCLRLEGTIDSASGPLAWRGEIRNLTTDPAIVGQPVIIRATTQGAHPLIMEATLDRTTRVARDRIVLSLPAIPQPQRTLGNAEQLAVSIGPGNMLLWAELSLEGETLSGRLLLEQKDLNLSARLPEKYGERMAQRLRSATQDVDTLQAEVLLTGTLDNPAWKLRSNLGPQLAANLTAALRAELEVRQVELAAKLDQHLAAQQARLQQQLAGEQEKVMGQLGLAFSEVDALKRVVAGRLELPGLGGSGRSPLANPFFRR